jgi:hypothetical protein
MHASPFLKEESEQDVHFLRKQSRIATIKVNNVVTDFFPNSNDVPLSIRFWMALTYVVVIIACFVALFYTGYTTALKTTFLSPYTGGNPTKHCELVPISYTGTYLASRDGFWEGDGNFTYSSAILQFSIVSYAQTTADYFGNLDQLNSGLSYYGVQAAVRDLGFNLLLWMSLVYSPSAAQRYTLVGTPLTIFDRDFTEGTVSR